jgi:beta-glucosidase
MSKNTIFIFITFLFFAQNKSNAQSKADYKNPKLPIEQRVKRLLAIMTLDEKVGQLNQLNGGVMTGPQAANDPGQQGKLKELKAGKVGSFLNVVGAAETKAVQKIAVEETRLGIPLLFAYDAIHGYKTVFPIPLAEACSFDLALTEKTAAITAKEAAAAGLHWVFAPMMDVSREPRWGRVMEGFGEDPYLGGLFAAARVKGLQGNLDNQHVMACVKHFAAYGAPEGGRDYNTVDISHYSLWNNYLPPYKAALDAGALTVMNSFNVIDGVPASANRYLMQEILKKKWGYNGVIVSDWGSYGELINHGYAENGADAAQKALMAGSHIDMESRVVVENLAQLVKDKKVPMSVIDEAVSKVLYLKFKLGLFENPYLYSDEQREASVSFSQEHQTLAHEAARNSMVLLKNDNKTLPFSKNVKRILVVGHLAESKEDALDFWCGKGESKDVVTYLDGIKAKLPSAEVVFAKGYDENNKTSEALLKDLSDKAKQADIVIAVIGITGKFAGEARALGNISPADGQMEVLKSLQNVGKPMTVLVHAGRPMILTEVQQLTPSILNCWIGGTKMGAAAADILFGDHNPSAKTVMSFPYAVGQIPVYYNCFNTGRPHKDGNDAFWVSRYQDIPNSPLYPFGYGLSYSNFDYKDLKLSAAEMSKKDKITATVTVKNTSDKDGEEIVQLYVRDMVGSYVRPLKELKGFQKVAFKAGETKTLTFIIDPAMLSYYDENGNTLLESGKFKIFIGGNSRDVLEADLRLK